jgi:hypothetical protein
MVDYGVAGLENPDFPHCEKGLFVLFDHVVLLRLINFL